MADFDLKPGQRVTIEGAGPRPRRITDLPRKKLQPGETVTATTGGSTPPPPPPPPDTTTPPPVVTAPAPVTGLAASVDGGDLVLSWSESTGATSYIVEPGEGYPPATVTGTTYRTPRLDDDNRSCVRAQNAGGQSTPACVDWDFGDDAPTPVPDPDPDPTPGDDPPAPQPGGGGQNEPSGFTRVASLTMDPGSRGTQTSIRQYPTENGNAFARYIWNAGHSGGSGGVGTFQQSVPNYTEVYLRYRFRYSSNYEAHPATNKQVLIVDDRIAAAAPMVIGWQGGPMQFRTQNVGERNIDGNVGSAARGVWNTLEIVVRANGSGQMWLNGNAGTNYGPGTFWTQGGIRFNWINFDPIWGGTGGSVDSQQTLDIDDVYVSGR